MTHDWIIDVLADLKTFAAKNGLVALADQLNNTALVASSEISSQQGTAREIAKWDLEGTGRIHRTAATR